MASLGVTGCGESGPEAAIAPQTGNESALIRAIHEGDRTAAVELLAKATAFGLRDPGIRAQVASDMAASPWHEGKLVLQDYIDSNGAPLLEAMAQAPGIDAREINQAMDLAGSLDFYLPFRQHRESWNGRAAPIVLGAYDPDTRPIPGFTSAGTPAAYAGLPAPAPAVPVIMLHAAEVKFPRQDSRETVAVERGSGLRPMAMNGWTTYLDELVNFVGDAVGDAELELRALLRDTEPFMHELGIFAVVLPPAGTTGDELEYALFPARVPDSSSVDIRLQLYERDDSLSEGGTKDLHGIYDVDWAENGDLVEMYHVTSPSTLVARIRTIWTPADPQEITSLEVADVQFEEGMSEQMTVLARDQYGYHIPFSNPDYADLISRIVADPSVATLGSPEGENNNAFFTAYAGEVGGTEAYVTASLRGSVTDTSIITVIQCVGSICPERVNAPVNDSNGETTRQPRHPKG